MTMLYPLKFILAFCSIVYELLLAQSLSAFMQDTVLRYSVTIGLYLLSLGAGAWIAEGKVTRRAALSLSLVEIVLTVIGGLCVVFFYLLDAARLPHMVFAAGAHVLIIVIGLLTGMEIPLVVELRNSEKKSCENVVLAWDYAGALAGTLVFAFVFYSRLGLVPAAFLAGVLNALAGISLFTQKNKVAPAELRVFRLMLFIQAVLFAGLVVCLYRSAAISEYFVRLYLR